MRARPVKRVSPARKRAKRKRDERRKKIADEVKFYIEDKNISRLKLEKMVGRSESTMNHFFAGDFSDVLLARIEHALNRRFGQNATISPAEWGGYTREGTTKFVGSFLTLRYDFKEPQKICAYVTVIEWGDVELAYMFDNRLVQEPKVDGQGLVFREEGRIDKRYTHSGQVWFPGGQFLYLVSAYGDGRLRAAIVSAPDNGKMTGIQLSQYNPKGAAFTPAAAPIAFLQRETIDGDELGYFLPGDRRYDEYKRIVTEAMDDVVFALPSS